MTVEVYGSPPSAPCRFVYMVCEMLGINYKIINIDLGKGDNMKPEYLKV